MWHVVDGRLIYSPQTQHVRLALGAGDMPDTLTYIRREVQDA